jgi:hypothetical protein
MLSCREGGPVDTVVLRVEGEPGSMDAGQSLRVLTLLAEVLQVVAPDDAPLPLTALRASSAVAEITSPDVAPGLLIAELHAALSDPSVLPRYQRNELTEAFRSRGEFGIDGFGYGSNGSALPFDEPTYRRVVASLDRPITWTSVSGVVRGVGRTRRGVSGRITNEVDGRVVNFDAPSRLEDPLREALFRRATLSGTAELTDEGVVRRMQVDHVEHLGDFVRLTDLNLDDFDVDHEEAQARLRGLRDE